MPAVPAPVTAIHAKLGPEPLPFLSKEMRYVPSKSLPPSPSCSKEIVETIDALAASTSSEQRVGQALLFFAAGELDRAHNLVLPLSWPSATPFAGPPVKCSAEVESEQQGCGGGESEGRRVARVVPNPCRRNGGGAGCHVRACHAVASEQGTHRR